MNAMRLAVKISFVVLASKSCTLAMAQDVEQRWEARVRQADSPEQRPFASAVQGENVNRVRPDDRLQGASSATAPASHLPPPGPDQQGSTAPSTAYWQDDNLEGCCDPCCNNPCPTFYGQVEALFMKREPRFTDQPIIVDANAGTTFVSSSDLDFEFGPGVRATIGMHLCEGPALEFSYFGLCEGEASAVAISPDPGAFLIFPDNLFGNVFVDMDIAEVNYSSSLHSFEANLLCCCGSCEECGDECCDECGGQCGCSDVRCRSFEWFGGFRYLYLDEELNISAQRIVAGGLEEGSYDVRTTNHLYGLQLGARERRTRGRWGWEATGKAGIFGNYAQQEQTVTDFPNFVLRPTVSSSSGGVAFIGETNLSVLYRLTDIWNLRAGYSLIWIEGLALAPDQLDFDFASSPSGDQLDNGGAMFLHGANFGVEARW